MNTLGFVENEIVLSDGRTVGEGFAADPWIRSRVLVPILAVDEVGLPRYRLVYLELPRGHWKSGGVAAVAVAEAGLHPSTEVVVGAADTDQARIILENVAGYLARNPTLRAMFRSRRDELVTEAGSRIRVISSDAPSAYGLGGTHRRFRVIADELTSWKNPDLWVALASASGKTPNSQTIVLSNAGFDAERAWQWDVRKTAEAETWGYLFAADGVVASWITDEWVEQMRALLPGAAFDRLIGNVWTTGAGDFVTPEQWQRCVDERLASNPTGDGGAYYGGLDLGLTKDRTAFGIGHRDGDVFVLDELSVWQGTRADPVSILTVEQAVADAADRFRGLRIAADPWQLKGSIERLGRRVEIDEFTFSQSSVQRLSSTLHHAITSASLRVFPEAELSREILGLRVVETGGGWRFDHRSGGYSDRAVALAMAVTLAQREPTPRPYRRGQGLTKRRIERGSLEGSLLSRNMGVGFRW